MSGKLVEKGLIACANFFEGENQYLWKEQPLSENEVFAVFKTLEAKKAQVEDFIITHHPYDTPCILHWPINCNPSYFHWMTQQIK